MLQHETPPMFSVSQVSAYLKEVLETDELLRGICVQGEVSGCRTYPSGHCYFTLKDAEAQMACVFFKNARMRSNAPILRDGMAIVAVGRISFYEKEGKLQLYVDSIVAMGEGALFLRFEQLKARLAEEGLFDAERKRPLPEQPAVIGIVTSPQAAALRDMLRVLHTRYPLAEVILAPTLVQGAEAPAAIAGALDLLNRHGQADVIIVGRGGGSIEELWAFNEEVVARAIARSRIPVISGVGHETDVTIADFVADYRASTPTAAATAAVPDIEEWRSDLLFKQHALVEYVADYLTNLQARLERTANDLQRTDPQKILELHRQGLEDSVELLRDRLQHLLELRTERLRGLALRLHSLSPLLTIARGYAIVRKEGNGAVVTSIKQARAGELLTIQVSDGTIPVIVRTGR